MAKTVVITQSNYIPWRGYFDLIRQADELILLDSVQFTRRDWRNRNLVRTSNGLVWLTIPVEVKGKYDQSIDETLIADEKWAAQHLRTIGHAYARARHAGSWLPRVGEALETAAQYRRLTDVNEALLRQFCNWLGIKTTILRCTDVLPRDELVAAEPAERILSLARAREATRYLSGPRARAYLEPSAFKAAGIDLAWMSYEGYPEYPQCWGGFEAQVSIVDLLINMGSEAALLVGRTNTHALDRDDALSLGGDDRSVLPSRARGS